MRARAYACLIWNVPVVFFNTVALSAEPIDPVGDGGERLFGAQEALGLAGQFLWRGNPESE